MGAFQVNRNKDKRGGNVYSREKKQRKDSLPKSKADRLQEGLLVWGSFYRANPHRFIKDYFGIDLKLFQMILIYMMFHSSIVGMIAARGIGKVKLPAHIEICEMN